MSLQDPTNNPWVMDSGASNHIATQPGTLCSLFNNSIFSTITVGNGSSAPVTHTENTSIPSTSRPLLLRNVLVCPSIIKNLISVRRFVTDNMCSVEFDPFGFCIKDLPTRRTLLRCNSDGPLYTITSHASSPQAFSISAPTGTLWHRRLGHTGKSTLKALASSSSISITKTDLTTLCHACQLGKQVRLPFYNSSSVVSQPFELIHSDLWTSPVSSISGIKYDLIFLDDYSHFVWVYPIKRKSDVFSRYLHFSVIVHSHFQRGISFLQCNNGRKFDNRHFRDHFAA